MLTRGGCSRLLTGGGGGALGRQMVFEAGRTPVVCGIGSCALLPDFPSYGVARGSNVTALIGVKKMCAVKIILS